MDSVSEFSKAIREGCLDIANYGAESLSTIEYSIDDMVLNNKEDGKRNLVSESDLIRLILSLIRNNKLKRVGI